MQVLRFNLFQSHEAISGAHLGPMELGRLDLKQRDHDAWLASKEAVPQQILKSESLSRPVAYRLPG